MTDSFILNFVTCREGSLSCDGYDRLNAKQ